MSDTIQTEHTVTVVHLCRMQWALAFGADTGIKGPLDVVCMGYGSCGALPGKPCQIDQPPKASPSELDLAAIRERHEATPPGPWTVVMYEDHVPRVDFGDGEDMGVYHHSGVDRTIASFVVHAHADIPRLLAAIEARDAKIAELQQALDKLTREQDPPRTRKAILMGALRICCECEEEIQGDNSCGCT